jgi:hypothetical protein
MCANNLPVLSSKEWVTDSPFIISPRITFEVTVRLLGGLMALGYTIATILKRSSHVFTDGRVIVKIDWLEQLNRHYIQVMNTNIVIFYFTFFSNKCHYLFLIYHFLLYKRFKEEIGCMLKSQQSNWG